MIKYIEIYLRENKYNSSRLDLISVQRDTLDELTSFNIRNGITKPYIMSITPVYIPESDDE